MGWLQGKDEVGQGVRALNQQVHPMCHRVPSACDQVAINEAANGQDPHGLGLIA
jgi:hypothetical protein